MAPRAYWKGHVRLSLVSFPVMLHAATSPSDKISLHQYDKDSGSRIRYQKTDERGNKVPEEDIIRGYEYEKGSFVPLEDKDLESLRIESKHTLDLVQFTDADDIDPIYFERAYYLVPDGDIAEEAYLTVRDALKKSGKVALGQIVLGNKERIACLRPCAKGLILDTLRYAYEVRTASRYFDDIPQKSDIAKEQLDLALQLIEQKTKPFDPKAFKDHYEEGLKDIIRAKLHGKKPMAEDRKAPARNVVNIVEALKKSLAEGQGAKPAHPKKRKPTPKTKKHEAA